MRRCNNGFSLPERKVDDSTSPITVKLENENGEKEDFCLTVAHEIRSFLTNLSCYNQALLELYAGDLNEQGQRFLQDMYKEISWMDEFLSTVMDCSRNDHKLQRETIDLSRMAKEIAGLLQFRQPDRRVTFHIAEGIKIRANKTLFRAVLGNLFRNAWKYSGKKDSAVIEFGVTEVKGKIAYFVRDNGVGFDMNRAHDLFGAFQRLEGAEAFEGHGIGLRTVQRIIRCHGGQIWAEGKLGEGATFHFTL